MRDNEPLRPEPGEHDHHDQGSPASPIHRAPELDGDDYDCCDDEMNAQVAALVDELQAEVESGQIDDGVALIAAMRRGLEPIGEDATDTIVKENVRNALLEAVERSGLEVDWRGIYGW